MFGSRAVLQPTTLLFLFAISLIAGFIDSVAGGGGLITLPVLLGLPISPQLALGTNKLQAAFGSGSASFHFWRAKLVDVRQCFAGIVFTLLGASAGTFLVQRVSPDFLKRFIPLLLVGVALWMIFKPKFGESEQIPRMRPRVFYLIAGFGLGFYDGFIGPGTGTFWSMAFMLGLGFGLQKATAHTKVMNFASNIASLAFFLHARQVLWIPGIIMGAGQLFGARLGSQMVVARGTRFVRPLFLIMVLALTARLLWITL